MTTYYFDLIGEDHTQFVWETEAEAKDLAIEKCECVYPEARIMNVQSQDEYERDENERYRRIAQMYDDGYYFDD